MKKLMLLLVGALSLTAVQECAAVTFENNTGYAVLLRSKNSASAVYLPGNDSVDLDAPSVAVSQVSATAHLTEKAVTMSDFVEIEDGFIYEIKCINLMVARDIKSGEYFEDEGSNFVPEWIAPAVFMIVKK